jgi:hypothetical protein
MIRKTCPPASSSQAYGDGLELFGLSYLHRLGFVLERPKQRLRKADSVRREVLVAE